MGGDRPRIGTYRHTVWRWTEGVVRPNVKHKMTLPELAEDLGLRYIFTELHTKCLANDNRHIRR